MTTAMAAVPGRRLDHFTNRPPGPIRRAQSIGNDFVLVSGSNLHDSEDQVASDPAGLELIDTRDWVRYVLAPDADTFTVANGVLLVTGARWRGNVNPTGMGLEAYGAGGGRRFGLFAGERRNRTCFPSGVGFGLTGRPRVNPRVSE